jgi:hypothetical protein
MHGTVPLLPHTSSYRGAQGQLYPTQATSSQMCSRCRILTSGTRELVNIESSRLTMSLVGLLIVLQSAFHRNRPFTWPHWPCG